MEIKIKLLTKYINRYLRKDNRILDWSFTFNHDSIDIQLDYIEDYHQAKRVSFIELDGVPKDGIGEFSKYIIARFCRDYESQILFLEKER